MPQQRTKKTPPRSAPKAAARVWVELGNDVAIGGGRMRLLEAIAAHGSISEAARSMGVSYRAAWRWIDRLNSATPQPMVMTAVGGSQGGGTALTPVGYAALKAYWLAHHEIQAALDRIQPALATCLANAIAATPKSASAATKPRATPHRSPRRSHVASRCPPQKSTTK